jgi:hypothetical protein
MADEKGRTACPEASQLSVEPCGMFIKDNATPASCYIDTQDQASSDPQGCLADIRRI